MTRLLDRLESLGAVSTVDAALGRLLAAKSPDDGAMIGLAAALASAALAQGHSCLPLDALHDFAIAACADDARAAFARELPPIDIVRRALRASALVARDGHAAAALVLDAHDRLYLRRYFNDEQTVAQALLQRVGLDQSSRDDAEPALDPLALRAALSRYFGDGHAPDREQRSAVLLALRSRLLIVSGGPGTGKTSTVLRLLAIKIEQALSAGHAPPRIALCAPTGKAAARLSETLREPLAAANDAVRAALPQAATTLHRLLGIVPGRARPRYDREHPLPCDLIVVDEASMLDLALAARLCAALAPSASLILLGDRDQLASVEAGSVFGALCAAAGEHRYSPRTAQWLQSILDAPGSLSPEQPHRSGERVGVRGALDLGAAEPPAIFATQPTSARERGTSILYTSATPLPLVDAVIELRSSHRFAAHSAIGRFARAVRDGAAAGAQDILAEAHPELQAVAINEKGLTQTLATRVLPHFAALATLTSPEAAIEHMQRFRVLCALREGAFGASAINAAIEHELRRHSAGVDAQGGFAGRLVMIAGNDPAQGLFNGDIGVTLPSRQPGAFEVWFCGADSSARALPTALLPAHQTAFALTVHKAQGSEFDDVLIVLPPRDARVLTRELLYTAVTRARKKVELWTSKEILTATIVRSTQRWSGLADALRDSNLVPVQLMPNRNDIGA